MEKDIVCIVCPNGCTLHISTHGEEIAVSGNKCPKGEEYAKTELTNPMRTLTSCVATAFPAHPVLPVRTSGAIPKGEIMNAMKAVNAIVVDSAKSCGDVIVSNFMGFGVDLIATDDLKAQSDIK